MPFIILGIAVLISGALLYRRGVKARLREMRNGAIAWFLAGFFLTLWGLIIIFTGKL